MEIHELLTIAAVTLAVITAYSLARDVTDESASAATPQLVLAQGHAHMPRVLPPRQ